jgi:23S rRNA (adenine2503-C2)-methyltransferase
MPINESLNLASLKEALTYYFRETHSPITYEYLLFNHFNDTMEDADKLAEIVRWVPSKVNIIMYNNVQGVELQRVNEERLNRFMKRLISKDVTATVRRSRGDDIDAGCGQLAVKEGSAKGKSLVKEKA